jgi:two-component system, sensor histidine kinase RpfC
VNIGSAALDLGAQQRRAAKPVGASPAAPSILLAEHNRILGKVVTKVLEPFRLRIHCVAQGADAIDALLAGNFALALIDTSLPRMNGLEVVKRYRFAAIGRGRIPIIGLVGGAAERIGACIDAGMDACLPKPIDPAHLLDAVRSFVQVEAREEAAPEIAAPEPPAESDAEEAGRPQEVPAMDLQVLKDLEQLGGRQFVEEIASQFIADANWIFPDLAAAIRQADVQASRDLLHALRSCAANVGASAIFELCLAWREIDRQELVGRGETCLSLLQASFEDARRAMRDHLPAGTTDPS